MSFRPPAQPVIGNAAAIIQLPAATANSAAYYADLHGAIHVLEPDAPAPASPALVTTFPFTGNQQELSFAVSPSGAMLDGLVVTLTQPMTNCQGPCGLLPGTFHIKLMGAPAGGQQQTLIERDIAQFPAPDPPRLLGWTPLGPVDWDHPPMGTQDGTPGYDPGSNGPAHYLHPDGSPGQPAGGAVCALLDLLRDGTALCNGTDAQSSPPNTPLEVHPQLTAEETVSFSVQPALVGCPGCSILQVGWLRLSPDGQSVAMELDTNTAAGTSGPAMAEVVSRNGSITPLASGFYPEGWLDPQTIIGTTDRTGQACPSAGAPPGNGPLAIVKLSDPTHTIALNTCGLFVGVVRPAS